ncbi:hypothetical protein DFAR_1860033 [Desulfarculales bacterium]
MEMAIKLALDNDRHQRVRFIARWEGLPRPDPGRSGRHRPHQLPGALYPLLGEGAHIQPPYCLRCP